ncbi:MAG: type II secretion system protein [Symploca sp. SIO3E6]|nr:type II secretion system protein [Caldora sp. SIO3E6]
MNICELPQKLLPQKKTTQPNQSGFTIIESLVAIIVISILMLGLSPVIFLSVAARVQSRRVERGTEVARTYIDGVRSGAIPATNVVVGAATDRTLEAGPVPTALNPVDWSDPGGLYCVDLDASGGCEAGSMNDMVVQGFRTPGDADRGYLLGVRVYRAHAFSGGEPLQKGQTQSSFSGTLGNSKVPVVEMTTEIPPSGAFQDNFSEWCARLPNTNPISTCN